MCKGTACIAMMHIHHHENAPKLGMCTSNPIIACTQHDCIGMPHLCLQLSESRLPPQRNNAARLQGLCQMSCFARGDTFRELKDKGILYSCDEHELLNFRTTMVHVNLSSLQGSSGLPRLRNTGALELRFSNRKPPRLVQHFVTLCVLK